ncbi:MAG: diphthamide synthesis protein [Candidatus Altiarchaeales archaeon]|nr:diphthamide synthesis protein [Candidatus Altiarchaeales archaeon]
MMDEYDFEVNRVVDELNSRGARFVALQFPEGLKEYALKIAGEVEEETNAKVIVIIDPSYGACDTKDNEMERLGVDLLIHFGHTELCHSITRRSTG